MQLFIKVSYSKSLIPHLLFNQRYLSAYSKGDRMRILLHAALKWKEIFLELMPYRQ